MLFLEFLVYYPARQVCQIHHIQINKWKCRQSPQLVKNRYVVMWYFIFSILPQCKSRAETVIDYTQTLLVFYQLFHFTPCHRFPPFQIHLSPSLLMILSYFAILLSSYRTHCIWSCSFLSHALQMYLIFYIAFDATQTIICYQCLLLVQHLVTLPLPTSSLYHFLKLSTIHCN